MKEGKIKETKKTQGQKIETPKTGNLQTDQNRTKEGTERQQAAYGNRFKCSLV
jgi:hypothetical protein